MKVEVPAECAHLLLLTGSPGWTLGGFYTVLSLYVWLRDQYFLATLEISRILGPTISLFLLET